MGTDKDPSNSKKTPLVIPAGRAKSGRLWKKRQTERSSSQRRKGVLSHMSRTFEQRESAAARQRAAKELEKEMKEVKRLEKINERMRREEKEKRRAANELKSSSYQNINPTKIKGMSKKQLRRIKKTSVNKFGQVELVDIYNGTK